MDGLTLDCDVDLNFIVCAVCAYFPVAKELLFSLLWPFVFSDF